MFMRKYVNLRMVKDLLKKTECDINSQEILDEMSRLRSIPKAEHTSTCQVVSGQSIRTLLPSLTEALGTNSYVDKAKARKSILDSKQKARYDQGSKDL